MLEEGECEHRHEGMTVKALPGSSLEVVEAEFLFQLLMGLFTNPSPLDGGGQGAQIGRGRQICEVVRKPLCHWLDALAFTGPDQPRHVKRTHPSPRFVIQAIHRNGLSQRPSSSSQFDVVPTMVGPSKSRPSMNH